jgi:hypothetical protein
MIRLSSGKLLINCSHLAANQQAGRLTAAGDDPHLLKAVEDLAVEQFIAQTAIEALDRAILPWAARPDIEGGDAEPA